MKKRNRETQWIYLCNIDDVYIVVHTILTLGKLVCSFKTRQTNRNKKPNKKDSILKKTTTTTFLFFVCIFLF